MTSITTTENRCTLTAVALSLLFATGCLGTDSASDSTAGDIGSEKPTAAKGASSAQPAGYPEDQELAGLSSSFRWFRWSKGDPVKTLMPINTHVCGLTMVRGQLATNTSLMVVRQGANWVLRGLNPGSNFLQADAVCEPLSAFRVNAGRTVSIAGDFLASTIGKNVTRTTPLPARTAAIFTGLVGRFEGGGERARTTLAPAVEVKNGSQDGTHTAAATALSFGLAAGQSPRFLTYFNDGFVTADGVTIHGEGGEIFGDAEDIDLRCGAARCPFSIAPLASTFCYLSEVSGDFNGADEWVQVFPDRTRGDWTMAMEVNSGDGLTARATCLAMDQTINVPPIIH